MEGRNNDILLIRLIEAGDERVLKHLFDVYFTPLCRFMHTYLDDTRVIEEEAMDIFIYLWQHPTKIKIELSIKAYLFQAARNKCLNILRKQKETLSIDDISDTLEYESTPIMELEELNQLVQRAILALPENSRQIFLKSRNEKMTNKEIADNMSISQKTVEKHITRSLKIIKDFLGDKYAYLF